MITFEEWLIKNHAELVEEGKLTNSLAALALTGASLFGGKNSLAAELKPAVASQQQVSQNSDTKRLEAIKKASDGSNFKKNWGSEFDSNKEQQIFKIILQMKTPEEHDACSRDVQAKMKEIIRVQTLGSTPNYKEVDKQAAIKSFDYQFLRYVQQLTIASKNALAQ